MRHIIDRQTFIISTNLTTLTGLIPSIVTLPMNLRFVADELILKSIIYNNTGGTIDTDDIVQISCNITNDNLIGAFPNSAANRQPIFLMLDQHFSISNKFQSGNFQLQFQNTSLGNPASYNPQSLISSTAQHTYGTVVLTIEFVKYAQ